MVVGFCPKPNPATYSYSCCSVFPLSNHAAGICFPPTTNHHAPLGKDFSAAAVYSLFCVPCSFFWGSCVWLFLFLASRHASLLRRRLLTRRLISRSFLFLFLFFSPFLLFHAWVALLHIRTVPSIKCCYSTSSRCPFFGLSIIFRHLSRDVEGEEGILLYMWSSSTCRGIKAGSSCVQVRSTPAYQVVACIQAFFCDR